MTQRLQELVVRQAATLGLIVSFGYHRNSYYCGSLLDDRGKVIACAVNFVALSSIWHELWKILSEMESERLVAAQGEMEL